MGNSAWLLNFYDRNVAGAVVEPMRKEFHLNDFEIGPLTTAAAAARTRPNITIVSLKHD